MQMMPLFKRHFPDAVDSALRESLALLVGTEISRTTLGEFGWRLAGNEKLLRGGISVCKWRRQPFNEWVPIQVLDCQLRRTKFGKSGAAFRFLFLAGLPTSEQVTRFWTAKFCGFVAEKLGFSKPWGKTPFKKMAEFVGLRLVVLVESELPENRKKVRGPYFQKVDVTKAMIEDNRQLIRKRCRINFECPEEYTHPCHICPIGYDKCKCGVHPRTFVKVHCEECNELAWTDPNLLALRLCLKCYRRKMENR
jgi:hypothetical protein